MIIMIMYLYFKLFSVSDNTRNKGKITEINLVIDVTDPEQRGSNKLSKTNIFKLNGSFLQAHAANNITNIV